MLTDWAVDSSRAPICSAMAMKRLLKTSRRTGSTSVPRSELSVTATRSMTRCPSSVMAACQPSSTTVVELASVMIAGPVTVSPGGSSLAAVQGYVAPGAAGVEADRLRGAGRGVAG